MKNPDTPPRQAWAVVLPLFMLFAVGFSFMVSEEIFKGVHAFTLHPSNE
jgi:hypothetical protein